MKTTRIILGILIAPWIGHAVAAEPAASAKAQYDAERARCMTGTTGQDRASCLKSAGAAYDAIRQDRLKDPNTSYRDNALARCKALPASDRADCESRVDGEGTSSGSVQDGGIIRQTVTHDHVNEAGTAKTNNPVPR